MTGPTRRQVLTTGAAAMLGAPALAALAGEVTLTAATRVIEVKGRAATVFGLTQDDGTAGLYSERGKNFRVRVRNALPVDTVIHWHGLTPPWQQDGTAGLAQEPIAPGRDWTYDFPLTQAGTHWMHSHLGLQEQLLLAAPLIVRDPGEADEDRQEVVLMLQDFTFRDPADVLAELRRGGAHAEVAYDAYLANDRTLDDPQVVAVEPGGQVRLRVINAASATQFWLDLGALTGDLVAVDGMAVQPVAGRRFEIAVAQRLDILLTLPQGRDAWPILAAREGGAARTGIVLASSGAAVPRVAGEGPAMPVVELDLESRLRAVSGMGTRRPDKSYDLVLGEGAGYDWLLNGVSGGDMSGLVHAHGSLKHGVDLDFDIFPANRIEIAFINSTMMAHPMHLHGHSFQVVAIDGMRMAGAVRDTVMVPPGRTVTVAFDARNPGPWPLHCHHLYHMVSGMMGFINYPYGPDTY